MTTRNRRVITYQDICGPIAGRDDPTTLGERCWEFLSEHHTDEFPTTGAIIDVDARAKSAIASARLQRGLHHSSETRELKESLAAARATIDRLLAFVPTRVGPVEVQRVSEIAEAVQAQIRDSLPEAEGFTIRVVPEADLDTEASTRVEVEFTAPSTTTIEALANAVAESHGRFVAEASPEERAAVRLIITPSLADESS